MSDLIGKTLIFGNGKKFRIESIVTVNGYDCAMLKGKNLTLREKFVPIADIEKWTELNI